jgi:hypothetical protein
MIEAGFVMIACGMLMIATRVFLSDAMHPPSMVWGAPALVGMWVLAIGILVGR